MPGVVVGYIARTPVGLASTTVFEGSTLAQLAVSSVILVAAAAVSARFRGWVRWLGGGAAGGVAISMAWLVLIGVVMSPSAASVTDKAGSRIANAHPASLERTGEFQVAPDGYTLRKSWRQSGCSDWFDRREPGTVRQYDAGALATDALTSFGKTWEAAGYHRLDPVGPTPGHQFAVWQREQDGWTASLSVYVINEVVEVTGRDVDSHACK